MKRLILSIVVFIELFSPILVWKLKFPDSFRYFSIFLLFVYILIGFFDSIYRNKITKLQILLLLMIFFWSIIAILNEQNFMATLWGGWHLFKYPFLFVFILSNRSWPANFSKKIIFGALIIIIIQILVQFLQILLGETDPDQLCGTLSRFRWGGQLPLTLLLVLSFCILIGWGVVRKNYSFALVSLIISFISASIADFKIIFFVLPLILILVLVLFTKINIKNIVGFSLLFVIMWGIGNYLFERVMGFKPIIFLQGKLYSAYFGSYSYSYSQQVYVVGRNYFIKLIWDQISSSPNTLLLGFGLGSRQHSRTLGVSGISIAEDSFNLLGGTSLSTILGEFGLIGTSIFIILFSFLLICLWRKIKILDNSYYKAVTIGVFVYTLLWPLWLWYGQTWTMAIPTNLYWIILGYVCQPPTFKLIKVKDY